MIEALQLRVSGVQGLADTFAANRDLEGDAARRPCSPQQADRLLASDVVWDDLFTAPTTLRADAARASAASRCPTRTSSRTAT